LRDNQPVRIRIVPTASDKHAVQVVSKRFGVLTVHKHIGSYADAEEKLQLYQQAGRFIQETNRQTNLFDWLSSLRPDEIIITRSRPLFIYQLLTGVYRKLGFDRCPDPVIRDLVIARVYAPASKRETREVLADCFDRHWSLITVYRHLKTALRADLKDAFGQALINFAKDELKDNLRLVFYDVTTLYFETAARVGLKNFGFSKDHRPQDAQVIIGLVVNRQGFPLYFDVFSGRTFEGHTLISVVDNIRRLIGYPKLVVVADAAMLSQKNINQLIDRQIGFIVGARVANLPRRLIETVCRRLAGQDGKITTVSYRGHRLICQYLRRRAAKDRADRDRQIARAQKAILDSSMITGRYRFVAAAGRKYSLNRGLIAKAERLEGIKGYVTNTTLPRPTVISRYHDLWQIENAFRITKSDLEARPVFHRLDETIKAHILIVFAGLAISRYLEINTGMSIKKILKLAEKVLTHKVTNRQTGETADVETTIEDPELKAKIELLKSLGH
jgi:hypothetical protein